MSTKYHKLPADEESSQTNQSSSTSARQITDLQDSFGEQLDDEYNSSDLDHLLPSRAQRNNPAAIPVSTDGVFANISAKPETNTNKLDETPPTYEEAAADATPPYWQTTIIAPAGVSGDIILVEGLPVGGIFAFFWNLLVSASFQFVGFMLTYLLHTSHASKQGAKAGLGVTLVQTGLYIRSKGTLEDDEFYKSSNEHDETQSEIIAYILMLLGWFIIMRSLADYCRAKQMENIIRIEPIVVPEGIV